MARFVMEARIISVQRTKIEDKIYAKVFVAEEPDGQTEQIASIMTMELSGQVADEVFAAAANLRMGQLVKLDIETERGGKQSTKNVVLHIAPIQQTASANKPAEPAKV